MTIRPFLAFFGFFAVGLLLPVAAHTGNGIVVGDKLVVQLTYSAADQTYGSIDATLTAPTGLALLDACQPLVTGQDSMGVLGDIPNRVAALWPHGVRGSARVMACSYTVDVASSSLPKPHDFQLSLLLTDLNGTEISPPSSAIGLLITNLGANGRMQNVTANPAVPAITSVDAATDTKPVWNWSSRNPEGSGVFRLALDDVTLLGIANTTTATTFTPDTPLTEGLHSLFVQEQDSFYNWSEPVSKTILVDFTPPSTPTLIGPATTRDVTPTWSWSSSGSESIRFNYKLDDPDFGNGVNSTEQASFTPDTHLSFGVHTLYVQAKDAAGNLSAVGVLPISIQEPDPGVLLLELPKTVRSGEVFKPLVQMSFEGAEVTEYQWDFGDGNISLDGMPQHVFEQSGRHVVRVTAKASDGRTVKQSFTVEVEEPRYVISGTITGFNSGETVILFVYSETLKDGTQVTIEGFGAAVPFIIGNLRPASDYRIQVQSDGYIDGYWGGNHAGTASSLVGWFKASLVDLSQGDVAGINLQIATGYDLTVIITGVNDAAILEVSAWSKLSGGFEWDLVVVSGSSAQVTLPDLPVADDYLINVETSAEGLRSGFYIGENQSPGSFLQAVSLSLNSDQTITMAMTTGQTIVGTLSGLIDKNTAWVEAWSKETFEHGLVEVTTNGIYTIKGLAPARDYVVCVETDTQAGGCYAGANADLASRRMAMPVDLMEGSKENIDLSLGINRVITGKVVGLSEGEIAWVEAWSSSTGHWTVSKAQVDGTFELTGLRRAGDYRVVVEAEGYKNPPPVPVSLLNDITSVANFNLSKGGSIQGTVTGLVAGEFVTLEVRSLKVNDSRGITLLAVDATELPYRVEGLADADDYIVMLHTAKGNFFYNETTGTQRGRKDATAVAIASGASKSGIDFSIAFAVSYSLSGTITGLSEADASLMVTLTAWAEEDGFGSTKRIGNGLWSITGLPAGNYHLAVSVPRYIDQVYSGNTDASAPAWSSKQDEMRAVTLAANLANLNITLASGYSLTGTLTDATGVGVSGIYINAWDSTQDVGGGVTTRVDGSFEINGLQGGEYVVEAMAASGRLKQTLTLNGDNDLGTITLVKAVGTIRGTTAAGAMVFVYDASESFVGATVSDGSGNYQVDGLEIDINYRVDVDTDGNFNVMEFTGGANPTAVMPEVTLDLQ